MANLKFTILASVLCSLTVLGQELPEPVTILLTSSASSSLPEVTSTISTQETSKPTTKPTTAPTDPPTTKPTTPTTPPTLPPNTPTPTPAPAPTPAPGPVPPPKLGKWSYTDKDNRTCILVQFAAQFNVTYTNAINSSLAGVLINVPPSAVVVDGNCNGTKQWLTISWPANNATANVTYNNLGLIFLSNSTTNMYELKNLSVSLSPEVFPNSSSNKSLEFWHGAEWQIPFMTSYRCANTQLKLSTEMAGAATVTLSQLQEEAFRNSTNQVFSAARECSGGDVPDAVPIAVGCALGGLVLVVLVAYLVGRRRSAARGYLSM